MWQPHTDAITLEQQQQAWHYQHQQALAEQRRAVGAAHYAPDTALATHEFWHTQVAQQPHQQHYQQTLATTPSALGQQQQALMLGSQFPSQQALATTLSTPGHQQQMQTWATGLTHPAQQQAMNSRMGPLGPQALQHQHFLPQELNSEVAHPSPQHQQQFMQQYHQGVQNTENSVILVDTLYLCSQTVSSLLQELEVAVDVEGVDLSRNGSVCLIQITAAQGVTYLFDITTLGQPAFEQGRLRELLQSDTVCKVIFDGRADNDALFHRHGVLMHNAYDLQVLHAIRYSRSTDTYVKGLQKAMEDSGVVPPLERQRMHDIKESGKHLFAPDFGGSYAVWLQRPLLPVLLQYAAADVRFLLAMKRAWGGTQWDGVLNVTAARINKAVHGAEAPKGQHMAIRDFPLMATPTAAGMDNVGFCLEALHERADMPRCLTCGQVGHAAQNCNQYIDYLGNPAAHIMISEGPDGYLY